MSNSSTLLRIFRWMISTSGSRYASSAWVVTTVSRRTAPFAEWASSATSSNPVQDRLCHRLATMQREAYSTLFLP